MDSARDLAEWTDLARRELVDLVAITSFSDVLAAPIADTAAWAEDGA